MKQSETTIDFSMRTPIINNDKEVFTNKRDLINHCLEVMGHQRGAWLKVTKDINEVESWLLMYFSFCGEEEIFMSSFVSEQGLWDRSEREALRILNELNCNRSYDTQYTLEDVIASAKASGEDASYWQDLLDTLNASVNL
jgi:hypothetical protein